jgi:hypothetical protein
MKDTSDELKDLPESAADSRTELIYPDLIELYLYRCLAQCVVDPDVSTILVSIETDLGEDITTEPPKITQSPLGSNPMVQNLMNMAGDLFKNINRPQSSGEQGDTQDVFNNMANTIGSQQSLSKMGEIMSKLQTTPPNQIMDTLKGLYNDPEIQKMVRAVVDPNLSPDMVSSILNNVNNRESDAPDDIPVVDEGTTFAPEGEGFEFKN